MSILLVDSYDSFTFNLKNLIETATNAKVYTIHNDTFGPEDLHIVDKFVDNFDAIIIGPGPGNPRDPKDVGIIPYLLSKKDIPILGICLGFQCLCDSHGSDILYLEDVVHGQVYPITKTSESKLFEGMNDFKSVRYHSIYVKLNDKNDLIIPLATTTQLGASVLMAAQHKSFPHYGVQYHPESICSEMGDSLVKNFWKLATEFNKTTRIVAQGDLNHDEHIIRPEPLFKQQTIPDLEVNYKQTTLNQKISNIDICDFLGKTGQDFLLLNSASFPGEWSIIGLPILNKSEVITHSTQDLHVIKISKWLSSNEPVNVQLSNNETVWSYIANFMEPRCFNTSGIANTFPFVGGLVGFFSYEEGEFLDLQNLKDITQGDIPDTKLCFIERFILHDLKKDVYYVVSIVDNDAEWIEQTSITLSEIQHGVGEIPLNSVNDLLQGEESIDITSPERDEYMLAFNKCQKYLKNGDSYELCLTTATKLRLPSRLASWDIYKVLTKKNPSPYSCFMKFDDAELLSSSPERFISWNNEYCQLRPIKGTVKKTLEMTLEKLTNLLKTPKEMGENLMIVDLIRHDLYAFLENIEVVQLMTVEEYKTVYQLVSVINGKFENSPYKGLDILSLSLPPGSMTGAPKKRSVELLQSLENHNRRGIYSGVCGYYSLNNKSDWSVIIRSCFNYTNDLENDLNTKVWRIGAGGAITVLSDCEGEWEEMKLKLESALQAFKL